MPYHFRAIALDYDGTLTERPRPTHALLEVLRELRAIEARYQGSVADWHAPGARAPFGGLC